MTEQIAKSIQEAQMVLVGIGEEFEVKRLLKKNTEYQELIEKTSQEWLHPFLERAFIKKVGKEYEEVYKKLAACLEGKNYFVISLCQDGMINSVGLNGERVVEPCGTYEKLQCSEACENDLYDVEEALTAQIEQYVKGEISEHDIAVPVCPKCGKPLVFNRVEEETYIEEGYLPKWQTYKLWLQGTVNRKLCVLELGAGMKYPSVIRWPFEKVTFFNQKAELYRVHSWLYQMAEEIKERGYGICQSPIDFVKELSNMF